ncbi:MAG TPA: thioesterase family protein [Chloroflexia bacterium]|nr:thioesterase family protein [Chloroflexia bacterium]
MLVNSIEFQVELGDTDAEGIVFYPKFFRWFDRSTHALLNKLGLQHRQLLGHYHCAQPVIDCGCHFVKAVRNEDHIKIESQITEIESRTFRIEHRVFCDRELVASGFELRCWVKTDEEGENGKLKVVPIPQEIAAKLGS